MMGYAPASDMDGMARRRGNDPAGSRGCQARGMKIADMDVVGRSKVHC
jgi:hypothetical protein